MLKGIKEEPLVSNTSSDAQHSQIRSSNVPGGVQDTPPDISRVESIYQSANDLADLTVSVKKDPLDPLRVKNQDLTGSDPPAADLKTPKGLRRRTSRMSESPLTEHISRIRRKSIAYWNDVSTVVQDRRVSWKGRGGGGEGCPVHVFRLP
jgi:hypothetical protein